MAMAATLGSMRAIAGVKLLILDDWGLEPLGPEHGRDPLAPAAQRGGWALAMTRSRIAIGRGSARIADQVVA